MLERIRVVLVATSHPGNIGAAARALKTMGLTRLHLVAPERFPHAEATAMASGADDLLAAARVFDTLEAALEGASLVLGASARTRNLSWPLVDPREAGRLAAAGAAGEGGEVALVFGRERSGLTNEELARCHYLIHIPANPDYSSLNVAAAVQVLCYEARMASLAESLPEAAPKRSRQGERSAAAEAMEGFYEHLERVLVEIDFLDPQAPGRLMLRLRRLFGRIRPTRNELNILRGILTAVQSGRRRSPNMKNPE